MVRLHWLSEMAGEDIEGVPTKQQKSTLSIFDENFLGCGFDVPMCLWCTYSLLNELPIGADCMFPRQTW